MNITIFGTGYVGLVTGACLAEAGNSVVCVDIDHKRIATLRRGEVPIHEPGLDGLVNRNRQAGRLEFTTDVVAAVASGQFQIIAVGTPPDEDGSADLSHVLAVATSIGDHMDEYKIIVDKSTVPVGTAEKVRATIDERLAVRSVHVEFDVVANPEFLKEGAAVADCMKPDRIIVGSDSLRATRLLRTLYDPFTRNHDRFIVMDVRSAELTKYAANAMLATKISFMNELANLAERMGADVEQVRIGIGADPRIGYHFIYPGSGYGGSCFPKDLQALIRSANDLDYQPLLLNAVEHVNEAQKRMLFRKIREHFGNELDGRVFALWGLAFKPNTDDMRAAPSRVLMEALWNAGAVVRAYDPAASGTAQRIYGRRPDFILSRSAMDAAQGADAVVINTEWREFRSPDFGALKALLKAPVIFDGRNVYDPAHLAEQGYTYYAIGRPPEAAHLRRDR